MSLGPTRVANACFNARDFRLPKSLRQCHFHCNLSSSPSTMSCPHTDKIANLQPPRLSQSVHREECTQCFDNQACNPFRTIPGVQYLIHTQDGPDGIDVCLACFNGGCLDTLRHHARTHVQKSGHRYTLNIKRRPRAAPSPQRVCSYSGLPKTSAS